MIVRMIEYIINRRNDSENNKSNVCMYIDIIILTYMLRLPCDILVGK